MVISFSTLFQFLFLNPSHFLNQFAKEFFLMRYLKKKKQKKNQAIKISDWQ